MKLQAAVFQSSWRPGLLLVLVSVLLALPTESNAHQPGQSYLYLNIEDGMLSARAELIAKDLNAAIGLPLNPTGKVDSQILARHERSIQTYATSRLTLSAQGELLPMQAGAVSVLDVGFAQFILVELSITSQPAELKQLDVGYDLFFDTVPDHNGFVIIENNWHTGTFNNEAGISLTFHADHRQDQLDLTDGSRMRGFLNMVDMGMRHIAIGLDHILFLLGLLLTAVLVRRDGAWQPSQGLRGPLIEVLKIVTVFTIAHSVTLSLATLGILNLPPRLVESIIALSIAIVAIDIYRPLFARFKYWVIGVFGLFHGFGFAGILAELPIPKSQLALTLLGFNLGVEIGQVIIVLIVLPILFLLRQRHIYTSLVLPLGAAALLIAASYWFIERAFDINLPGWYAIRDLFG